MLPLSLAVTDGKINIDVEKIVRTRAIETHFQPIVSIRRKSLVAVEALSRGVDDSGRLIAPRPLFNVAAAEGLALELDRACREAAVENFLPLYRKNPDLILFLNFEGEAFERDAEMILDLLQRVGIEPRNVAVEVLESEFEDTASLRKTLERYRRRGFLLALDDMGVGYSNLDRIVTLKPDILKADVSLVRNLHREYHKQEVFKSLVTLSEKIGGWTITEGVEQQEEVVAALGLGADLMQGFYFARPHKPERQIVKYQSKLMEKAALKFKEQLLCKIKSDYYRREERTAIIHAVAKQLIHVAPERFEDALRENLAQHKVIESACVLDENGVQATDTILNSERFRTAKTIIFQPPAKNTDHSLKEYFYVLKEMRISVFETQPYVPLPSEKLCITISTFFKDVNGKPFILCLHTKAE